MSSVRHEQNERAARFRALHKPGDPLVLCNVYDGATAGVIAKHGTAKAVATTSYAVAVVRGKKDEELTFEMNLAAAREIASAIVAAEADVGKGSGVASADTRPLTVDAQDGYGERLEEFIKGIIEAGAMGCNLEDITAAGVMMSLDMAASRVKRAMRVAAECGVPNFALNARTDILTVGGTLDEAIQRGKAYLAAGATTVLVWGKTRQVTRQEIKKLVEGLGGYVNVIMGLAPGFLTVPELRELGVARISVGPGLFSAAMKAYTDVVDKVLAL